MIVRQTSRNDDRREVVFLAWVAWTQLVLAFVTWPLWWLPFDLGPVATSNPWMFPQVPLFSWALHLPLIWDRVAVGGWILALVVQGVSATWIVLLRGQDSQVTESFPPRVLRRLLVTAVGLGLVAWPILVIFNQHRCQAWAYLAWWIGLLWLLGLRLATPSPPRTFDAITRWKWLAISVYFYSALSKFDLTFLQSLGNQFATALWNCLPGDSLALDSVWPISIVLLFPLGELILALGLACGCFPKSFCLLAITMHSLLLLILGPWGLQHQPGVLVWNCFFIGQACVLFWPRDSNHAQRQKQGAHLWPNSLAGWALYAVVLWPLTQPWGWCDHWPAWELYAPRGSRVQIFLAEPAWDSIGELEDFLAEEPHEQHGLRWRELRLDQWSLEQLKAPIYPQDRFQLGVADYVFQKVPDASQVMVQWYGPANRWNGKRQRQLLRGPQEWRRFSQRFFLNCLPRSGTRTAEPDGLPQL